MNRSKKHSSCIVKEVKSQRVFLELRKKRFLSPNLHFVDLFLSLLERREMLLLNKSFSLRSPYFRVSKETFVYKGGSPVLGLKTAWFERVSIRHGIADI